jgi:hypothetical protein
MAKNALANKDRSLVLSDDTYVRFGLVQQDPTRGLAPGLAAMMPTPPGVDPSRHAALMGYKPSATFIDEVAESQAADMQVLLRERKRDPQDYELISFRESPDPGVTFLWMAAVRS